MAGMTLAQAQQHFDLWMAADLAVASGQSYEIHGRKLTRADAALIAQNIQTWEAWLVRLSRSSGQGGSMRVRQVVPR